MIIVKFIDLSLKGNVKHTIPKEKIAKMEYQDIIKIFKPIYFLS